MAIFNSYVGLPEGISRVSIHSILCKRCWPKSTDHSESFMGPIPYSIHHPNPLQITTKLPGKWTIFHGPKTWYPAHIKSSWMDRHKTWDFAFDTFWPVPTRVIYFWCYNPHIHDQKYPLDIHLIFLVFSSPSPFPPFPFWFHRSTHGPGCGPNVSCAPLAQLSITAQGLKALR